MLVKKWNKIPEFMRNDKVYEYWKILRKKNFSLFWKRVFDIFTSLIMLILLFPLYLIIAIMIKADSKGPVMYRQERVTQYGKHFRIHKFRTMRVDADKCGTVVVTKGGDNRITKVGAKLRRCRLDETAQLLDIVSGNLSFVGTRPSTVQEVSYYTDEMNATLLLPAGVTSRTSIEFRDEGELLKDAIDPEKEYVEKLLPLKMERNLSDLKHQSFWRDIGTMFRTVGAVLK